MSLSCWSGEGRQSRPSLVVLEVPAEKPVPIALVNFWAELVALVCSVRVRVKSGRAATAAVQSTGLVVIEEEGPLARNVLALGAECEVANFSCNEQVLGDAVHVFGLFSLFDSIL